MLQNLIIVSHLSCEPCSEGLFFRYLTGQCKESLSYNILLEAEKDAIDYYWRFLKERGWFYYVDDFILENQESGIRIDTEFNYSNTIVTKGIRCENALNLFNKVKSLRI